MTRWQDKITQEFQSHLYFYSEDHLFHKTPYIDIKQG